MEYIFVFGLQTVITGLVINRITNSKLKEKLMNITMFNELAEAFIILTGLILMFAIGVTSGCFVIINSVLQYRMKDQMVTNLLTMINIDSIIKTIVIVGLVLIIVEWIGVLIYHHFKTNKLESNENKTLN